MRFVSNVLRDWLIEAIDAIMANSFVDIAGEFTGGCAASCFASAGAPTVCGVGPVGGKAHTEEEYIEIELDFSLHVQESKRVSRTAPSSATPRIIT